MKLITYLGKGSGLVIMSFILAFLFAAAVFLTIRSSKRKIAGRILFPVFFIITSIGFLIVSITISGNLDDAVGPAIVPILWLTGIIILSLAILLSALLGREQSDPKWGRVDIVAGFTGLTILYLYLIIYIGYFIATLIYLPVCIYILSYRNWKVIAGLSAGWIVFSYVAFYRLLYVPLPRGILIERIFG